MSATPRPPKVPPIFNLPKCPWCECDKWTIKDIEKNGQLVCHLCAYRLQIGDLINGTYKVITPDEFYKNVFMGEE